MKIMICIKWMFSLLVFVVNSYSQYTHPGCAGPVQGDFKEVKLVQRSGNEGVRDATLWEPVQFDFEPVYNTAGDSITFVNLYFIERREQNGLRNGVNGLTERVGYLKKYNAETKQVEVIGKLKVHSPIDGDSDHGIKGLALHPDFKNNKQIFIQYSAFDPTNNGARSGNTNIEMRVSRFILNSSGKLALNSEKVLLVSHSGKHNWIHHGGAMDFDSEGNLYITMGNSSPDHNKNSSGSHVSNDSLWSAQIGAGNTASFNGSILKIHPDNSALGYSIPADNFGEYWSKQFDIQGKSALAAEYLDVNKVLPEIFSKGHRSNYSITTHPTKNWVTWGDVNPGSNDDEWNIVNHPVFAGYPYFYGNQKRTAGHNLDPLVPRNTSSIHSGVVDLPPAMAGTISGTGRVNMTGPIYVYDTRFKSAVRFPPHFNDQWFTFDWSTGQIFTHKLDLDNSTNPVVSSNEISNSLFRNITRTNPLEADFGPDGAFYMINYAGPGNGGSTNRTEIIKIEYTGSCQPVLNVTEHALLKGLQIIFNTNSITVQEKEMHTLNFYGLNGTKLYHVQNKGQIEYYFEKIKNKLKLSTGLYFVEVVVGQKKVRFKVPMY